ncbi:GIY-YIG nuclease family protein [Peptoniphilus sp. KCTC 25270]|uniref:GIY-YIG nuclease family protein n=1 Tax=Peptoniphilus sp. KCTC 25270 TaxID=2897414 RepID=UPI001E431242|nr:GIY-YIG nuclease family protein [Peptoniphilus sp. KCTC 25270]MCD1147029.1 GIY-YIG nuclease family protein [Peptoniphilus sp. KCTC 25270]
MKPHYVYILICNDNTLYTGYTINLEKRLKKHNDGIASKYTRCRLPVSFAYVEKLDTKSDALKREIAIKKLSRSQKIKLIQENRSGFNEFFND